MLTAASAASAAAILTGGCGERHERTGPPPPVRLTVATGVAPAPLYAPLYTALSTGDFSLAGLQVTITPAGQAGLTKLESGAIDVAVTSEPELLRARDAGQRLVSIGALAQGPLEGLVSIDPHAVAKAEALDGRKVATSGDPLALAELNTVLRHAGVDSARVHRLQLADPARALLGHRADVAVGLSSYYLALLDLHHLKAQSIPVEAAGVPTYDRLVLAVREADARRIGPRLRAFLQALGRGAAAMRADPERAARATAAGVPHLSGRVALATIKATLPALFPADHAKPFGWQDPGSWQTFGTWLLGQGLLSRPPGGARAVTGEFLPGQGE